MTNEEQLIGKFYACFNQRDCVGMQACYHDDIEFSDPVFPHLKGKQPKAMWHMLCAASKDIRITVSDIKADAQTGGCKWNAAYTFSRTNRPVLNKITAGFKFKDGKIIQHHDDFNFWAWSKQALGTPGLLLGWTPIIKNKVRRTASNNLIKFIEKNEQYK